MTVDRAAILVLVVFCAEIRQHLLFHNLTPPIHEINLTPFDALTGFSCCVRSHVEFLFLSLELWVRINDFKFGGKAASFFILIRCRASLRLEIVTH